MFRTTLRAGLAGLVVAVSFAFLAPFAQAAPTPTPTPTPPPAPSASTVAPRAAGPYAKHIKFTTTGNLGEKMTVIAKVLKYGNKKTGHLDWSAAKKYFGDHTTWRDDFAAGFQGGGGTLDNAAKSTKSRLRNIYNTKGVNPSVLKKAGGTGGTNCTGVTKKVNYNKDLDPRRSEAWYNSCTTNEMLARYGACTILVGLATGRIPNPWANAVPPIIAAACGIKAAQIATAQKNSNVSAIKYWFVQIYQASGKNAGQYYVDLWVRSQ